MQIDDIESVLTLRQQSTYIQAFHSLSDWKHIGELHVKIFGAKGLNGKPVSHCILALDNEGVETHNVFNTSEPVWNKNYIFNIYDITSALELLIEDNTSGRTTECLGKLVVPLLRITNGQPKWYALKDKNKKNGAKGNCPRVLLELTVIWNPVKAAARIFQPKEIHYIKEPPKFNIGLIYSNLEFVRDTFNFLQEQNEKFKRLFEWDNNEYSLMVLICWLLFWHFFRYWTTPLLLLIPFCVYWLLNRDKDEHVFGAIRTSISVEEDPVTEHEKLGFGNRIHYIQEMTITITNGIEYMVSLAERVYHLVSFKVPFLSYISMILLVLASIILYYVPFNHIIMAFGTFKFTRKCIFPNRILNNDLLDFLSRVPDNRMLKEWNELNVPEPTLKTKSTTLFRTHSSPFMIHRK